jgi:hypothetical protein
MFETIRHGKSIGHNDSFFLSSFSQNTFDFSSENVIILLPCVSVVARQQLGKQVPTATNILETMELFSMSFSMQSVSYEREAGDQFIPKLLVFFGSNFINWLANCVQMLTWHDGTTISCLLI